MPNPINPHSGQAPEFTTEQIEYLRRQGLIPEGGPECEIPPDAATRGDNRNPRRRDRAASEPTVGTLIVTSPRNDMATLILHSETKDELLSGLRAIELRAELDRVWNLSAIEPQTGRCILNFYGKPGTGKTKAALAVARRIGRPLYKVDYAAIISKYLGDTAKHISMAFAQAAELRAVLFFDEADSLLSKRVDTSESCSTSINQNRNVLMQCLDAFNGIVIMTTNLFQNYDEALLRRIAKHIEFRLPNRAMRKKLFELHLPKRERVEADLAGIAAESSGLSGGDIKNVCLNSIYAGSAGDDPADWKITQAILRAEIDRVKAAKEQHARKAPRHQRPIGFNAEAGELEEQA